MMSEELKKVVIKCKMKSRSRAKCKHTVKLNLWAGKEGEYDMDGRTLFCGFTALGCPYQLPTERSEFGLGEW